MLMWWEYISLLRPLTCNDIIDRGQPKNSRKKNCPIAVLYISSFDSIDSAYVIDISDGEGLGSDTSFGDVLVT